MVCFLGACADVISHFVSLIQHRIYALWTYYIVFLNNFFLSVTLHMTPANHMCIPMDSEKSEIIKKEIVQGRLHWTLSEYAALSPENYLKIE